LNQDTRVKPAVAAGINLPSAGSYDLRLRKNSNSKTCSMRGARGLKSHLETENAELRERLVTLALEVQELRMKKQAVAGIPRSDKD
jgi:hypothetical protein